MKYIRIGILMLIPVIAGCQQSDAYFYNPDKTLEQAQKDCETCHEPLIRATVSGTAYSSENIENLDIAGDKCMKGMGYSMVPLARLPDDICTTTLHRGFPNTMWPGNNLPLSV